tara:strand:+ start:1185 stop:1403 length:219 start_codon:yes stop_codon:yes gene_type:complete
VTDQYMADAEEQVSQYLEAAKRALKDTGLGNPHQRATAIVACLIRDEHHRLLLGERPAPPDTEQGVGGAWNL